MVALQIAREPLVRQVLRQTFQERAKLNIAPTKKGKKVREWSTAPTASAGVGRPAWDLEARSYGHSCMVQ